MSATCEDRIDSAILRAGTVDYLDVWFITGLVADTVGAAEDNEAKDLALEAIGRLLRQGRLRAGDLRPPGEFEAWSEEPDASFDRVRLRLRNLDGPLGVGDVAWFRLER